MPVYTFRCQDCQEPFEKVLRVSQYDDPQDCPACESENTERTITSVNFVLKGDSWPGKMLKVKEHMADRRKKVEARQEQMRRDSPGMRLVPNVGGERVDSWSEAKKMAASQGKDTSGYDSMIRKEKVLSAKPESK